ncbi:MAG: PEP-CTERM motif protein [Lentisphaerae bacterium ADurb.BinA184]|nr:MAG: PEP-CTERM motif protein [Lentisphaerae bacterium ADurb.BinA184]
MKRTGLLNGILTAAVWAGLAAWPARAAWLPFLEEDFNTTWDGQVVSPVNLPGASWAVGQSWGGGGVVTYGGAVSGIMEADLEAKASLLSAGGYVKPTRILVEARVQTDCAGTDGAWRGALVGFSSTATAGNVRGNEYGIVLRGADGQVGLLNSNVLVQALPHAGTWDNTQYHTLSYWVDTATGNAYDVMVDGVAYAFSPVSFFTDANTNYGMFYASSQSAGGYTRMDNLRFSRIPEPASLVLVAGGGLLSLRRRRRARNACGCRAAGTMFAAAGSAKQATSAGTCPDNEGNATMKRSAQAWGIVVTALLALAPAPARAEFIPNLALGRPVFATSAVWDSNNLVDEAFGLHAGSATWHFAAPYAVGPIAPYFGGVDLGGVGNTVQIGTIRIRGGDEYSARTWTLQSRDSAADPLDGLVDSGWTDTGVGRTGDTTGFRYMVHSFASPVDTRALRFRMTEGENTNDRLQELEVFSADPHGYSRNAIDALDPALSREDGVPITTATSLERLRDNAFDEATPDGVPPLQYNLGDPLARAVMNYDFTFPKAITLDGLRFYFIPGIGNSHANSDLSIQTLVDGVWTTVAGGSQEPDDGLNVFDFSAAPILTDLLRISHTAYDINGDPRSALYAYEIELYGTPIPEPAALMLLAGGGTLFLGRRRGGRRAAGNPATNRSSHQHPGTDRSGTMNRSMTRVGMVAAVAVFAAVEASAAVWTNLAVGSTVGGNQGAQTCLIDEEGQAGNPRWHQTSTDFDANPGRIYFHRGSATDMAFIRFWDWSDPATPGPMAWRLQQLTGADPNNDADWTDIAGTSEASPSVPRYYHQTFAPVTTSALRWYITGDNLDGAGNLRYTEFEIYGADQNALDLTGAATQIVHSNGTNLVPYVAENNVYNRYDGPGGAQKVTMLWSGKPLIIDHLRIYSEDRASGIQAFTLQYLRLDGDPLNDDDWLATGIAETNNYTPILNYDLGGLVTLGLRLDITDPSTNGGHEILRLRELEVFGTVIPEPSTVLLLAAAGLPLLRRRG